ncbi:uncharacterized protein LOC133385911 isoform X2 [Rhineura floridana]|uniref:uncharacterized protein LOC133385911 isoform X2 n=1 Tax=Rhineura floridana TaxID=261503 RepID=UPI002AC7F96A|nr:uncharacterized protein LOC133385911 isoform X2 [Rhineura floridana]
MKQNLSNLFEDGSLPQSFQPPQEPAIQNSQMAHEELIPSPSSHRKNKEYLKQSYSTFSAQPTTFFTDAVPIKGHQLYSLKAFIQVSNKI